MIDGTKLGQTLVREGLLNEAQLKHALDLQRNTGGDLRDILPKLGYVREPLLMQYIAREERMHWVDPEQSEIDTELMAKIPRDVIERHQIVPLRGENGILLAVPDPEDFAAIDEVQFLTNRPVESALASRASIKKVLSQYYQRAGDSRRQPEPDRPKPASDLVRRLSAISGETLVRALIVSLVERGQLDAERLLTHAAEVEGLTRGR